MRLPVFLISGRTGSEKFPVCDELFKIPRKRQFYNKNPIISHFTGELELNTHVFYIPSHKSQQKESIVMYAISLTNLYPKYF